jgi:hypothetical protein
METGLYAFAQSDEPYVIDVFDRILEAVKRRDCSKLSRRKTAKRGHHNGRNLQIEASS